jgi:hypothetical protein
MLPCVVSFILTDVSEVLTAYIIRVLMMEVVSISEKASVSVMLHSESSQKTNIFIVVVHL